MTDALRFTEERLTRPQSQLLTVSTTLRHFALVTYAVDPERLQGLLPARFVPDCIQDASGVSRALVSVVPFLDVDFRFARCPWPAFTFGQTNYRAYVRDRVTGEHVVWFFGTCLDSWSVLVPRYAWKLPWQHGRIRFECDYAAGDKHYRSYHMATRSRWAPAELELEDSGDAPRVLPGYSSLESGLVHLTHPLRGVFLRRDGRFGTYSIWHARLAPTVGVCRHARFPLLDKLGLVPLDNQTVTHSVLLQHETDFTIYLPPHPL